METMAPLPCSSWGSDTLYSYREKGLISHSREILACRSEEDLLAILGRPISTEATAFTKWADDSFLRADLLGRLRPDATLFFSHCHTYNIYDIYILHIIYNFSLVLHRSNRVFGMTPPLTRRTIHSLTTVSKELDAVIKKSIETVNPQV